jgi:hypothetical protein
VVDATSNITRGAKVAQDLHEACICRPSFSSNPHAVAMRGNYVRRQVDHKQVIACQSVLQEKTVGRRRPFSHISQENYSGAHVFMSGVIGGTNL